MLLLPEGLTSNALSEIAEHWLQKYFHFLNLQTSGVSTAITASGNTGFEPVIS
jgi:hypothetical protein